MANAASAISSIDPSLLSGQTSKKTEAKSGENVDKNEFLQLLVTQLKNQDPLNPMENDRFAVDLATFSQVEQLMQINEKVGGSKGSDNFSSVASYLGMEVSLKDKASKFVNGDGGKAAFKLLDDAKTARLELLDSNGAIVKTEDLGELKKGRNILSLNDPSVPDGSYSVRIAGLTSSGTPYSVDANATGIVSGFIPGDVPKLIVGDSELGLEDVTEVRVPQYQ